MVLGSPIGKSDSINTAIIDKANALKIIVSRLCYLNRHDALLLLGHSFAIPKILYTLRTAPCSHSFDDELRSILSTVLNINLDSETAWSQATLPVGFGGIVIQSSIQLAPSAFLASAAGCSTLINQILPERLHNTPYSDVEDALAIWTRGHEYPPPLPPSPADRRWKAWDLPQIQELYDNLLIKAVDSMSYARLLAVATKESGAWLNALPVSARQSTSRSPSV